MKIIATALLTATLATAGGAFAQTSVSENGPLLSSEFGVVTYADQHRNDPATAVGDVFPASADVTAPMITKSFPNMVTYSDEHRNDPATQVGLAFPVSVDENGPMLASEFPARQANDVSAYAGAAQPNQN